MTTRLATILRNALGVVAVLLTVTTGRAATPSFDSFDTNDFRVVKTIAPWKILSNTANTTNNFTNVVVNYINSTIITTNTIITNVNSTIVNTNTTIINQGDTIINTNVTQLIDNSVVNITNTVINITNTVININGNTNGVGSLNPTIGRLPYKQETNSFGDSSMYFIDTNTTGTATLEVTDLANGGVVVSLLSGVVTNIANGTGALTNDGVGNLGWSGYFGDNWVAVGTTNSQLAGNAFIGSGYVQMIGGNVSVGSKFSVSNAPASSYSVIVGNQSMQLVTNAQYSVVVGANSADIGTAYTNVTSIGYGAMDYIAGNGTVAAGAQAFSGANNPGYGNIAIGYNAGLSADGLDRVIMLGPDTGFNLQNTTNSVILGANATATLNGQMVFGNGISNYVFNGQNTLWPFANALGALTNDGAGNLGWADISGANLWTNNAGILEPVDLTLQPMVTRWYVGTNSPSYFGATDMALNAVRQPDTGETQVTGMALYSVSTNGGGYFDVNMGTNVSFASMAWNVGTNAGRQATFRADSTEAKFLLDNLVGDEVWSVNDLGVMRWTPTNAMFLSGNDIVITNSAGSGIAGLVVATGDGIRGRFSAGGNLALVEGALGVGLWDSLVTPRELRWAGNRFWPLQSGTDLGGDVNSSTKTPFQSVSSITNSLWGYIGGNVTNWSRLMMTHTGTNGVGDGIVFDSQASGSGGTPRPIALEFNGTNLFQFDSAGNMTLGPGSTNVVSRSGKLLSYYNSDSSGQPVGMVMTNGGGTTATFAVSGNTALVKAGDGGNAVDLNNGTTTVRWSSANAFAPIQSSTELGHSGGGMHGWQFLQLEGMTKAQKGALTAVDGMIVYQTDNTPGLRAYVNGAWVILNTSADP